MEIEELLEQKPLRRYYLRYSSQKGFYTAKSLPKNRKTNRDVWARFYDACVTKTGSNKRVRAVWNSVLHSSGKRVIPSIVWRDGFLANYTLGNPLRIGRVMLLWNEIQHREVDPTLNPIKIFWNERFEEFFDIVGAPPGFLSKFVRTIRLRRDSLLLGKIASDLQLVAEIEEHSLRKTLTLAILSHAAAYRELEGRQLAIPSFTTPNQLICYTCNQHLIEEGVKTISLIPPPSEPQACGIYLCQGTEIWPSQQSTLGSIVANFAIHGSATEAYAHSWRRIHKHLKDLVDDEHRPLPIITGHSMGGSLAIQVALYSHGLIQQAHAFNPPMPNERDYEFYTQLAKATQSKVFVHANLDDFAFWRIGSKVIGNVTIYFGKKRWRYYPISLANTLTFFPAVVKLILNLKHAFPAHQHVFPFDEHSLMVTLTKEEIELENKERSKRFDYLRFFPKLYDPMRVFMKIVRRTLGWSLEEEFLRNELEIVMLHEQDLCESSTKENGKQMKRELMQLTHQKEELFKKIAKLKK